MTRSETPLLVACLCAEWCGVCRDYRKLFAQVAAWFADQRFVWVDVEDEADLVDPIEVETFPTLLIASDAELRFFGAMPPQAAALERIVRECAAATEPSLAADDGLRALAGRLRARM